jgi:aspartate/methionine/tyrosine aminotransferase
MLAEGMELAKRVLDVSTESAFEVLAKAKQLERQGRSVIHFEIGEPDWDTPDHIKEAAIKALREGFTHYTPSAGIPELRQAIAEKVLQERGVHLDYESQILITPGAKPNLLYAIFSLANPGDRVLIPDPSFPSYWALTKLAGAVAVPLTLTQKRDFTIDPEQVRKEAKTGAKLLILSFPSNPCGSVLSERDIKDIAEIVQKYNLWVLSDEIYRKFVYEGQRYSSVFNEAGMTDRTVVIDSFSKTYAMTGWRLGFALGPSALIEKMTRLQIHLASCPNSFVQKAALEALMGPQDFFKDMLREYDLRRKAIVDGLNAIKGFHCSMPKGAFYAFPNTLSTGLSSKELSGRLLNEALVATLDGASFGAGGDGFLRLSYATNLMKIKEGLERMKEFAEEKL